VIDVGASSTLSLTAPVEYLFLVFWLAFCFLLEVTSGGFHLALPSGNMGDPWDHPAILASIDDLCSRHFRGKKSNESTSLSPGPTVPASAAKPCNSTGPPVTFETLQSSLGGVRTGAKLTSLLAPPDLLKISQTDRTIPTGYHSIQWMGSSSGGRN
jgi:hypothetical protein